MTDADPLIGQRITNYVITRRIGHGSMGVVYQAQHLTLERDVAIKFLAARHVDDSSYIERFLREARAAAHLNHPNLIAVYDAGVEGDAYYIVMEYVEGNDLARLLKERACFPEKEVIFIGQKVAIGLACAHNHNIIHRDIKPENLILTQSMEIKIADLGLAKRLDEEGASMTMSGMVVGTPFYISPEQIRGTKEVDGRTDIYSLGTTLYHLSTGYVPFQGASSAETMSKHLTDPVPWPKIINPKLSDSFCHVLYKMMAKDPLERYQKMEEVSDVLGEVLNGVPVSGRHEMPVEIQVSTSGIAPDPVPKRVLRVPQIPHSSTPTVILTSETSPPSSPTPPPSPALESPPPAVEKPALSEPAASRLRLRDAPYSSKTNNISLEKPSSHLGWIAGICIVMVVMGAGALLFLKKKSQPPDIRPTSSRPNPPSTERAHPPKTDPQREKLFEAAKKGDVATVKMLVENGVDTKVADEKGLTPLIFASQNGHAQVVNLLLEKGVDVNAMSTDGTTPLMEAAARGHLEILTSLTDGKAYVEARDNLGRTALMLAATRGRNGSIEALVAVGADVNVKSNDGSTSLKEAAFNGHADTIELLLKGGADINQRDKDGWTVLMHAALRGHIATVDALISKGADVSAKSNSGYTALKWAEKNGHAEIMERLKQAGAKE